MNEDPSHESVQRWERPRVAAARRGDTRAFAELYRAHAGRIFARVLMPRLGNRAAAEDALAETFRVAFEKLGDFEERDVSIYYWLSRIAMNKAMDMHRARKVTGRALATFEGLLGPLREGPVGPARAYEDAAELDRLRGAIGATLAHLSERYRRAIELRFFEERSREECAAALEVKLGTFDVVLLRALRAFRREWERHGGGDAGARTS